MRLIDADKLHPDRMTNRGTIAISQSQIANAPTVDVLGKIRAEIAEYKDDKIIHAEQNEMIDIVLEILDKYR